MKKYIIISIAMLALVGSIAMGQIKPIKKAQKPKTEKTQKPKAEQTQKQNKSKTKSQKSGTQSKAQKQNRDRRSQNVRSNDDSKLYISISCSTTDAVLYIDGLYYGNISGLHEVTQGSHYVSVIANGYETYQEVIDVSPSKTSFYFHLKKVEYLVTINCNVDYASLYIDGTLVGFVNTQHSISPGSHTIKIVSSGYEDKIESITVYSDTSFSYALRPNKNNTRDASSLESQVKNKSVTVNGITFKMIGVEGGTFTMGATQEQRYDAEKDEHPAHSVTLTDYYIGECEVTQELWKAVMGKNPSHHKDGKLQNLPVDGISWDLCQEFIAKLNQLTGKQFRLPTEAEWEFAARGGKKSSGYRYSGTDDLNKVWYLWISNGSSQPVGLLTPNELGIYDMSGNLWEWCSDWYGPYNKSNQTNPTGHSWGTYHVLRGGSFNYGGKGCRVSIRYCATPSHSDSDIGFRLAATSL